MKTNDNTNRLKTYKIKNHDSGKTYSVKAVSYADAKMKYNKHILKDSITEDAADEYTAEKYKGTEWGVFAKRSKAWVAFGTKEKMTELAKRLNESDKKQQDSITEDADNIIEWKTYAELGKKLRQLGFDDFRVHQIMEAIQDGEPVRNVGNLKFKRIKDSLTEDADKVMGIYKGYTIKQNVDGNIYVLKKSGEKEFFESWKAAYTAITSGVIKDSLTEDVISKLVQNYLSSKKPKTKAEQDEIINFLLERNKIAKEDVQKVRSLLKIVKDSLTEDADKSMGTYNGYSIKQNVDGNIYVLKKSGEKQFFESWKKAYEAIKTGTIKDSITEDAVIYGEWESLEKNGLWYVNTNDLQKTKRELKSAGYKYESHSTNLKGMMYKYTVQYRKDSITKDSIKFYKIKNHDSGQTFRVNAVSYTDAIKKYNEHILKDSLTEDATLNYIENYKGVKIYQNSDNKKYKGTLYTNRFMPIVSFEEKDLKTLKAKIDEARNKYIKNYGNLDSLTEDASNIQISKSSKEFERVIREYHKKYGKILQVESMVYNFETGKYYMYNESTDYSFTSKRLSDSIAEDADIAQNDIKSSYLPEDANADNIQYLGFNEKRKLSFYSYGDRYFVHYDLEGRTEEIDKVTVQKILKKNILGEIDENDLINKEPQAEEIVSDAFTEDTTVTDKLIGNGEVHFRYKGGRVITGAWNKNKLNEREISNILNKYNCKREQERWNDIVFSTRIGNEENLCKAFNEINPSYSVSELLSLHDSKERGDR